jgi:hypothetical protein
MAPGLTRTKTLNFLPSISTGRTILGSLGGLNEECTSVSSRSRTRVFLPYDLGLYGGNTPLLFIPDIFITGGY